MFDGDFGFGFDGGDGWGGGSCGAPPYGALMAPGVMPAPSGVVCPPQAMQGFDPCDPRIQMMLKAAYARDLARTAGARRGAQARAAAGQPAVPVGIGTPAGGALVPAGTSATFTVTPFGGDDYCFIDLDVGRATGTEFFLITNLSIGRYTPISDAIGIPADTLAPDAIHPLLDLGATSCNGQFSITVFNTDTAAQRFNATLWGIPRYRRQSGPCL
jgi:hypothetical protein